MKDDERVDELKEKAKLHEENLAALMITYPSTHGVFESSIQEITKVIHKTEVKYIWMELI